MSKEHVIKVTPELNRRVQEERRRDVRERIYRLDQTISSLKHAVGYWLDQLNTDDAKRSRALTMAWSARLHLSQETLDSLGETVEPCLCAQCVGNRANKTETESREK